jgi:hypothetical protein
MSNILQGSVMATASTALHDPGRLGRAGAIKDWKVWRTPSTLISLALLVAFTALFAFMLSAAGRNEIGWTRLFVLFGTVQSVLFAGLGAVFARHVLRERADTAERHANIAADRAERAADRADRLVQEAANGRALAAMIRAEATTLLPTGFIPDPEALVSPSTPEQAVLALAVRLRAQVEELFPAA